jgi:hypothetical protein
MTTFGDNNPIHFSSSNEFQVNPNLKREKVKKNLNTSRSKKSKKSRRDNSIISKGSRKETSVMSRNSKKTVITDRSFNSLRNANSHISLNSTQRNLEMENERLREKLINLQ